MDLSNLKPAEGSTKTRKRIGRDRVRVWAELLPEVIKEQSRVRVTNVRSVLKVVRCHFNAEFRNSVSRI
mgnify:CR=1 FL=1